MNAPDEETREWIGKSGENELVHCFFEPLDAGKEIKCENRGRKLPKMSCGDPGKGANRENRGNKLLKVECGGAGMGLAWIFRGYRNQFAS